MRKAFHFKEFFVYDDMSTMKVGTDAVLLGVWSRPDGAVSILDAGTGCGIVALMIAQRSDGLITAIDIDESSVKQATENFANSPWKDKLQAEKISLQEFSATTDRKFDLIVSNPPFFRRSLKPGCEKRQKARHDDHLSMEDLFSCSSGLLEKHGRLNLVLPAAEERAAISSARIFDLHLTEKLNFIPKEGKDINRVVLSFTRGLPCSSAKEETVVMRYADGEHSAAFINFTRKYYLFDPALIRQRLQIQE